jgi:ketosteroid isomerase-like protein
MSAFLDVMSRFELAELVSAYAASVDSRDWDRLGALFADDAVLISPDVPRSMKPVLEARGRPAVLEAVQQLSAFACTFHHVTGTFWTDDGEHGARGRTTTIAHHVEHPQPGSDETRSWVWHATYEDRCTRTEAGWQFTRRALTVQMIEARPIARVLPFAGEPDQ